MTEQMPTSEVLNRAADLIEQRGWATGNCGMRAEPNMPLCLEGAIAAALNIEPVEVTGVSGRLPGEPPMGAFVYPYSFALDTSPAYGAVKAHLQDWDDLWSWNDNEADGPLVIEVLRACAVIEASRERESAEVSPPVSA